MEGNRAITWRKSSYSGNNGGDCVEVGTAQVVAVRDSKDPVPARSFGLPGMRCGNSPIRLQTFVSRPGGPVEGHSRVWECPFGSVWERRTTDIFKLS